ncbi:MAG: hypothetical protein WAM82_01325 [Thermoanaerobaculia bacterium]
MRLTRTSVVTMVTIILLAMAVPAVQARSLEGPQPAVHSQGWLDFAMSWLARLAGNEPPVLSRTMKSSLLPSSTLLGGGHYIPLTGPCIDPQGNPLPRCGGV